MATFQIHAFVVAVFEVVAETNRYFANAEPCKLAKTDPARMRRVLYVTIETLRTIAILLQPIMPGSMAKLLDLLAVPAEARTFAALDTGEAAGALTAPNRLEPGRALPPPAAIFPRYVEPEA
jgi:methionyl-tRNA synthetase